jgi:CelD/BcsL family acetyltransferase involved in cellulose biosynthesis
MKANDITITCYENEVPPFVETEVDQLYGNIFSSLLEFRIYGWVGGRTSTYLECREGRISALLLFERDKGRVRVLNESIRVGTDEMQRFSDYIFSRYDDVNVISFKAIETDIRSLHFPYQRFNHLEDITLTLPADANAYHASLGKNTRRNIKRYGDRLRKTFPSYCFEVYEKGAVQEHHIRRLIEFNHARMADKNIQSVIDEDETRRIIKLAKACGLVGIATMDGKVVGGAVSYRSGCNYFLNILAHDPDYDDYWIGFLCCYETIRACIDRHAKEFHFLWGRYDYKFALGAVQRDLDNVTIYRSRLQLFLNGKLAWREAAGGYWRQAKVWVKYEDSLVPACARKFVDRARELKRSAISLTHASDRTSEGASS